MKQDKKPFFKISNICNQFIVSYMIRKKKQLQRIGMDRKAIVYNSAISNIRKYPMPIICSQQLKSIYGIGDALNQQLTLVIRNHYKDFLINKPQQIQKQQKLLSQQFDQDHISMKSMSLQRKNSFQSQLGSFQYQKQESKSNYSMKSATINKGYKLRPKTQAAYVLLIIKNSAEDKRIDRQTLISQLKKIYNQSISVKNLLLILSNLKKQQLIDRQQQDFSIIILTEKGLIQANKLSQKVKVNEQKQKIKNIVVSFINRQKQQIQQNNIIQQTQLKKMVVNQNYQLVLLIDNRQIKDKNQQNYFQNRIFQKYGIKSRSCNLPIGDFMWELNGQILNIVVERKKADDLLSSIFDGRYKQQKYRLKNSCFTNIYYIYEGHLTGTSARHQREVQSALLHTRVNQGFKVITTNNVTQTLKAINFITTQISNKFLSTCSAQYIGTLQQVTNISGKMSNLTVQKIFGLSLKTIPGVGKTSVMALMKHFKNFINLYKQLEVFKNRGERISFMRELLKGSGCKINLSEILVDMLFGLEG